MRVLIVDSDKAFCQILAEVLEKKGHDVAWTAHGLQAYKMSLRVRYELAVLDARMSPLPGTELAEALKHLNPGMKIILTSAFVDDALQNKAQIIGFPLLSKPFTTEKLLEFASEAAEA